MDVPSPEVVLNVGAALTVNDPFVTRRGLGVGGAVELGRRVGLEATAAGYPNLGQTDLTATTRYLITENDIAPDVSRITASFGANLAVWPLMTSLGANGSTRVGLTGGPLWLRTVDDLGLLQLEDDARYVAVARQTHLGWTLGLQSEFWGGRFGLRVRAERVQYAEEVGSFDERKNPIFVGVALVGRIAHP